jgi:site-specific recombinase XerD
MYVKQSFALLFYLKRKKMTADGKVPIYARLTIDGLEEEISTGIKVNPDYWENSLKMVIPRDKNYETSNKALNKMKTDLNRHFDLIQATEEIATPKMVLEAYRTPLRGERVKEERLKNLAFSDELDKLIENYLDFANRYRKAYEDGKTPLPARSELLAEEKKVLEERIRETTKNANIIFDNKKWLKTLILALNEHLLYFLQMTAADHRSTNTLEKMWGRKRRTLEFLEHRYQTQDVPLSELDVKFCEQFKVYNMTQRKTIENTATRYLQALKETMKRCRANGWISANPIELIKCRYKEGDGQWLTMQEMIDLIQAEFEKPSLTEVRDQYVFCAFTGLSYAEVRSLGASDIITGIDGKKWVNKDRQKTGGDETLPLLQIALDLIERYRNHPICLKRNKLLPVPTNQQYNRCLKVIFRLMGFKIDPGSHDARYFFANEVTFNQGVQLKTIARMLGHRSDRAVHTYVKANRTAISASMKEVNSKLFGDSGELKGLTEKKKGSAKVISMKAS